MRLKSPQGLFFIFCGEAAVSEHVGRKNSGKTALLTIFSHGASVPHVANDAKKGLEAEIIPSTNLLEEFKYQL
jgi:hypothetical protein